MMLYHGTRQTNPEVIYSDKEESFNINYSSDANLLGKGIYFAEESNYSKNYSFLKEDKKSLGGTLKTYQMLYCKVLVG